VGLIKKVPMIYRETCPPGGTSLLMSRKGGNGFLRTKMLPLYQQLLSEPDILDGDLNDVIPEWSES